MTQEERRRRLVAMGLDPTKYRYVTNAEKAARDLTQGSAFTTGVGSAIGPALGGIAGGAVPLALASGPVGWGALGLSVLGGLAGGYLGGKAQEGLEGAAYDDETLRELQLRRQAAYEKYPKTTFAGQVAPSLLAFRPSLTTLKSLPGAVVNAPLRTQTALQRYALTSAGVGGGLEAGVEAGSQALRGEDLDLGRIAMAGALGATLTEPTRMYGRLGATIGRTGQSGKDFLEARGMTRPLADDDPRLLEELQVARETVEKERTQQRREKERLKETAEQSAQKDSKPTPEQKKPTTPHEDETINRQLDEDIKNAEAEKEKAEAADLEAVKKNPPKGLRPTQVEHRDAVERLTNLYNQRARVAGETREQSTRADDLWNKHQRRQAGISGKDPLPPPKDLLKAAKGFAARQGMFWEEKVIDMAKRASDDQYRGIYDVHTHTAQLSTLAKEDTPWHEYLHGIWQVLKRSANHKHRQLIKIFEDDLLKKDGVPLSAEEPIVELGGRALERRMNDVSKDGKIARWFKDWRLERDARKGFPKKEGEKNDEYLGRLADWLAMRGERAPAMQPKQLKAFLRDLPVRHANDGFDSVEGGFRYSKDVPQPSEAPDEMRSRVGNIIKESLAATKADNISKGHIQNLIAAAKKANKISDEDTKWNSQLLDSLYSYEGRKIPRETVKEFLDAFEYRVSVSEFPMIRGTVENLDIELTTITVDGVQKKGFNVYDKDYFWDFDKKEIPSRYLNPNEDQSTIAFEEWQAYDAHQDAVENLSNILLGEKTSVDIRLGDKVYIPAHRKITKSVLRSLVRAYHEDRWRDGTKTVNAARVGERSGRFITGKIQDILEATAGERGMFRAVQSQFRKNLTREAHEMTLESQGYHHITKRPWLNKDDAIEFARKILEDKKFEAPYEDVAMIKGENYKTRALIMPKTEGQPTFIDEAHGDFGADRNALGWTRSNRQYLNSDGSSSKHIIELQSPLHQKAAFERSELINQGFDLTDDELGYGSKSLERIQSFNIDHVTFDGIGTSGESTFGPFHQTVGRVPDIKQARASGFMLDYLLPDQVAVGEGGLRMLQTHTLHKKLSKDPEFTFAGYKYKYDAKRKILKSEPYTQTFTHKDLRVVEYVSHQNPQQTRLDVVTPTNLSVVSIELPSADFIAEKEKLTKALREGSDQSFFTNNWNDVEHKRGMNDGLVLKTNINAGESRWDKLKITVEPFIDPDEDFVPMVPFRGHKYIDALVRDAVMSAVRDRDENVTWPATIEEIEATEGWDRQSSPGFHKGYDSGKVSSVYNLYVHGELWSQDGTEKHFFTGSPKDGGGKKGLIDAAFEKLIKDFKRFGPKGWKVEEDKLMYHEPAFGKRKSLNPEEAEAITSRGDAYDVIKVHRFRIPPKLRDMLLREGGIESPRYQRVTSEELNDALKIASLHDTSVQYSKRVRSKMMERIKAGTYSIAQGQKVLARFASKPFPPEMSGEEIAQVINGLEMYHGSKDAESVLREGFKSEELSPSSVGGRGIYMTPDKKQASHFGDPIALKTNFKKLLNVRAGGESYRTAEIAIKEGYDGMTYMYGDRREVVAFREPFQQATDQLHEYYGGERLQSVDDILKDTNDYQISSATDHFSSNPIIKNAWFVDSVVDKIRAHGKNDEERKISNMVADALDAAARDANRLEGEFGEGFLFAELDNVNLNREDARHVARYMVLTRRGRADEIPADTLARYNEPDSPVRHYVDYFKKQYKEVRDRQIAAGMKITDKDGKAREPGQDEDYYPELLNQEMRRELTGEKGASLRQQREDELVNWWLENAAENQEGEPLFTEKDAREAASAYIEKLTGNSNFIGSTHFAALRKAEGIGLPTTLDADGNFLWIDNSAANTYTRYMRRFARDFAFYTNVENNPTVAMVLGIKNQDGKRPKLTPEVQDNNPFYLASKDEEAKSATKDANIQDYIKGYLGYYDGQELVGRTANRLIVSHWLGLMSGVRDIMSSFVHALPYMRLSDAPAIAGAIRDFSKSWRKSHLTGVNRSQYNRLEFATETSNRLADGINRWADLMTVVTGRNILERSTRAFQFSLGRMVAMRQLQAEAGDVTANRTLARLQQMSGVDTKGLRGKMASEEQLDRLAAAWVELNQGTYDVRGVPNWTLYGPASMFTSLGRWNIEKFNRMRKDVMDPAIDDGDFRPLIKATLGTVITGTLLVEMAELINNKFNSNPTLLESAKEGNTEEAAYAVADLMNQVGYFGIMSALINDTAIQFSRGERIRSGGVVFPAYDFFANALSEPLFDANDAVKEGADFWPTYTRAITDVLKNTTQTYRIVWNQFFAREEAEKKNIRRDLRIFRRFEGERAATQPRGVGNPYLRPDTREFKESDTLGKAVETLPAAFEEQRERAAGRGDKLKEYTSGLYTIPEKGMPAIATTEGVDEFLRYRDYIMRQRGSGRWDRMFEDWARRKQLTATKKALVKSYVAHLMQTQRAR